MAASFAPYQDTPPETERALSPPLISPRITSPRASLERTRNTSTAAAASPQIVSYQQRDYFDNENEDVESERASWNAPGGFGGRREELDMFETRLGIRVDYEACLAYLLLPPAGPVLLLMFEHRSDYVRFHAWQSSFLFAFMFVVHIIFSWQSFISWCLFVVDLAMIGFLMMHAYQDASTLERYEIPFFGPLASSIVEDE